MLGRDHDGVGAHRLAVLVDERHLALGVGAELGRPAGMPRLGHLMQDAVRVEDRRGHERLGLAAGKAEHDALIAGALVLLVLGVGVDADARCRRIAHAHRTGTRQFFQWKPCLLVADLAHGAPRRLLDQLRRHAFRPAHLARHDDAVGGDERLDRDPRQRIGGQIEIDHGIGDAVAHLVGMAFRHRLAGEEIICPRQFALLSERQGRTACERARFLQPLSRRSSRHATARLKKCCSSRSRPAPGRRSSCAPWHRRS